MFPPAAHEASGMAIRVPCAERPHSTGPGTRQSIGGQSLNHRTRTRCRGGGEGVTPWSAQLCLSPSLSLLPFSGLRKYIPPHPPDKWPGSSFGRRGIFRALQGAAESLVLPDTCINRRARKINSLLIKFADVAKLGGVVLVQSQQDRMVPRRASERSLWAGAGTRVVKPSG